MRKSRVRDEQGRLRYGSPDAVTARRGPRLRQLLEEFAAGMEASGNLVILRTPPGAAGALADGLDGAGLHEVAGTVAGDDTILLVAREGTSGRRVIERLEALMGGTT